MKPIIILPPGAMSEENIALLRANELCVVVAEDPSKVKFLDPIPAQGSRTQMEHAAIELSRRLLNGKVFQDAGTQTVCALYVRLLVEGTNLGDGPTQEERDKQVHSDAYYAEIHRLAREEAKADRAALKAKEKKP